MRAPSHVVAAVALLTGALTVRVANAQVCGGMPSFQNGRARVGANAEWTQGARMYGAGLAYGAHQGPFGDVNVSSIDYDDVPDAAFAVQIGAGVAVPLGQTKKSELCPVLSFGHQSGPDVDAPPFGRIETSANMYGFGAQVGGVASSNANMDFIPFARAVYTSVKATAKFTDASGTTKQSISDDATLLTAGAGFVFKRKLTIQPAVSYPLGVEEPDWSYGIRLTVNFGSTTMAAPLRR